MTKDKEITQELYESLSSLVMVLRDTQSNAARLHLHITAAKEMLDKADASGQVRVLPWRRGE